MTIATRSTPHINTQSASGSPADEHAAHGTQGRQERRGILWMIGSFAICPCHLPVTLTILASLLGGTTLGAFLHENVIVAGVIITGAWAFGTVRGYRYLRAVRSGNVVCKVPTPNPSLR